MEVAFIIVMMLSATLLFGAATTVVQASALRQDDRRAIVIIGLPGYLASIYFFGQDVLALALGMVGVALWLKHRPRPVLAGVAFAIGTLTRETVIVVPAVIMLSEMFARRLTRRTWFRLWPLLLAPVSYAA